MAFIEPMHRNKPNITYLLTVAIWTHSGGSSSILVCAHCRSQEYAIGEMPSPVFMT